MARRWTTWILLAVAVTAWGGDGTGELPADPPLPAPKPGDVTGVISPPGEVADLTATCRDTGRSYTPAAFDRATGRFRFAGLPGDAVYDLCLVTRDGREIEGIDLSFVDARLLRLAKLRREQLGLPPEETERFTRKDAKELVRFAHEQEGFLEGRRVLYVRGEGDRATMLVELMRTRAFHASGGAVIWRVELWYFRKAGGGWERVANQDRTLRRLRTSPARWRQVSIEYDSALSVYIDREGNSKAVRYEVSDEPDPTRGRPANTPPGLKAAAHLVNFEDPNAPATQPAK